MENKQSAKTSPREMSDGEKLYEELSALLNRYGSDRGSMTPDFVLAEFMLGCLNAYKKAMKSRAKYGCGRGTKMK